MFDWARKPESSGFRKLHINLEKWLFYWEGLRIDDTGTKPSGKTIIDQAICLIAAICASIFSGTITADLKAVFSACSDQDYIRCGGSDFQLQIIWSNRKSVPGLPGIFSRIINTTIYSTF